MEKMLPLEDILSITTGRMVSSRGLHGVHAALEQIMGRPFLSGDIPSALDICAPYLRQQFPWIVEVDASGVNEDNLQQWMSEQIAKYGESLSVQPIMGATS